MSGWIYYHWLVSQFRDIRSRSGITVVLSLEIRSHTFALTKMYKKGDFTVIFQVHENIQVYSDKQSLRFNKLFRIVYSNTKGGIRHK